MACDSRYILLTRNHDSKEPKSAPRLVMAQILSLEPKAKQKQLFTHVKMGSVKRADNRLFIRCVANLPCGNMGLGLECDADSRSWEILVSLSQRRPLTDQNEPTSPTVKKSY